MDKKKLSEADICDKFIRPALLSAGWDGNLQVYREFPLRAGRFNVRGSKSHRDQSTVLRADFALFLKANIPIATIEAKDNNHAMGAGMAQAIKYSELLDYPERVVKEAIVNAIIHRDYRLNRDIFIRIFDDRIEVESPGMFPGNITPSNIARMGSRARNPLLSANLREFPVAPNIDAGEGVKMMFSEMAQAALYPPQYRQNTDVAVESVTVSLFNAKRPTAWDEVSDWLDRNAFISNADVVRISKLDTLKASKLLTSWRDQGLLDPVPGRGKRNMAYSKPTGGGQQELGLLSEAEDNNGEKE